MTADSSAGRPWRCWFRLTCRYCAQVSSHGSFSSMESQCLARDGNASLQKASTVILLRENTEGQLEVYLLRRSHKSSFMPGLHVFPGGSLEAWDGSPALPPGVWDEPFHRVMERLGRGLSEEQAKAHLVAAIRETFEETGVFLAEREGGGIQELCPERFDLREARFIDLLLREPIKLQSSRFSPWAHWITPQAMPKRFDTRFYLALHPEGQACLPDQMETTQGLWIRPSEGVLGNHQARIPLSPPALVTLQELSVFKSLEELRCRAWDKDWGPPRLPKAVKSPWGPVLIMPWDQDYSSEELGYKWGRQPPEYVAPLEPFSRLLQRDGVWHPVST